MPAWGWWLLFAAVLAVGETLTVTLVLGFAALGAAVAAAVALAGQSPAWQTAAFGIASVAFVVAVRPVARRHVRVPAALRTGTDALVGRSAEVVSRVDEHGGLVRLRGEVWSARLCEGAGHVEPGQSVRVLAIEGATALVYPNQ